MTTEVTISAYRRRNIDKIIKRLALCDIIATEQVDGVFTLCGTDHNRIKRSGMIFSPGGPVWSTEQCQYLLDMIETHGRLSCYHISMRGISAHGMYRHWSDTVCIKASVIPMEIASAYAAVRNAELLECYSLDELYSAEDQMEKAPWPDFAGYDIREGDILEHPDGARGTVVFLASAAEPSDQWRVVYGDGTYTRLCLQIGEKGRAVVVSNGGQNKTWVSHHVR